MTPNTLHSQLWVNLSGKFVYYLDMTALRVQIASLSCDEHIADKTPTYFSFHFFVFVLHCRKCNASSNHFGHAALFDIVRWSSVNNVLYFEFQNTFHWLFSTERWKFSYAKQSNCKNDLSASHVDRRNWEIVNILLKYSSFSDLIIWHSFRTCVCVCAYIYWEYCDKMCRLIIV